MHAHLEDKDLILDAAQLRARHPFDEHLLAHRHVLAVADHDREARRAAPKHAHALIGAVLVPRRDGFLARYRC